MSKDRIAAVAAVAAVLVPALVTPAGATRGAHFTYAVARVVGDDLYVDFEEVGVGSRDVDVRLSADRTVVYDCITCPEVDHGVAPDASHDVVHGDDQSSVTATASFTAEASVTKEFWDYEPAGATTSESNNGRISGAVALITEESDYCNQPGVFTYGVAYLEVVLTDVTNGASVELGDFSYEAEGRAELGTWGGNLSAVCEGHAATVSVTDEPAVDSDGGAAYCGLTLSD